MRNDTFQAAMAALAAFCALLPASATAATYEVGPGHPYAAIGEVPWESLLPDDLVLIHWRSSPYREKWVIGRSGAPGAPITVRGVPGPNGERPVIDGNGALTRPALDYWNEDRGLIKVGGSSVPSDPMPGHIVIEGLEVRSARPPYTFTDDSGSPGAYLDNAACIHVERGENVTIRDCELQDCGNGLFVSSSDSHVSRRILVEGNYIHDNGIDGSIYHHNNYTAALGITFQHNRFGPLRPGCLGNNLKDRSGGLTIRYNWIEGANRQLDLVDAEDSALIRSDPRYAATHVYGNVLIETEGSGNRQVTHYGGDSGSTDHYRKGTLHFYNNTVVSYRTDRTTLLRLSTNDERCDARNNLVYLAEAGGDTLSLLAESGVLDWSHNWLEPGWVVSFDGGFNGTLNDDGTSAHGTDPRFLHEAGQDFRLDPASPCIDRGTALHPAVLPDHDLVRQYHKHQSGEGRPAVGPLDAGAFEWTPPPMAEFSGTPRGGLAPLAVQFTDLSTGNPVSWEWDFEDDGSPDSAHPNPSNVYADPGVYSIVLAVANPSGTTSALKANYICVLDVPPGPVHNLRMAHDRRTMTWEPAAPFAIYDVVKGDPAVLAAAGGNFLPSVLECLVDDTPLTEADDPDMPRPGEIFYYLVRTSLCGVPGTYDSGGAAQAAPRDASIQPAPAGCP